MPIGMIIMKWDERTGAETLAKYPEELMMSSKTLMQVYSTHEYTEDPGLVSMMLGTSTIVSYFTGSIYNIYVILVLNVDEDPDVFEEGLSDISHMVIQNIEADAYKNILPSLFQRVSVYPTLDESQKLMMIYMDETKRLLLKRLRDEGSVTKSEIAVWLKDKYRSGFIDLESIISSFLKAGLVKQSSVKGVASESLFMINDILLYRIPVNEVVKSPHTHGLPAHLVGDYIAEYKNFFASYIPSEEDNIKALDILLDPPVYETLKLLRTAIATRDDLEKLKKKGVEDIEYVLKRLWEGSFISVLQDKSGNEYYVLKNDIKIKKCFPEFLINKIRQDQNDRMKNSQVLIEHIQILQEAYYQQKK
jgi:hypothetical protein